MKKKLILGFVAATMVAAVGSSATASANWTPPQTDITGVITENNAAVAGAAVTIECEGNTQMDTTDAHGSYLGIFPIADCPFGSTAKVTAQKDGKSGVTSGTVQGITTKLNLAIVNVSIPEYGLLGVVVAGGAGLGMVTYMRRRQQQAQF